MLCLRRWAWNEGIALGVIEAIVIALRQLHALLSCVRRGDHLSEDVGNEKYQQQVFEDSTLSQQVNTMYAIHGFNWRESI